MLRKNPNKLFGRPNKIGTPFVEASLFFFIFPLFIFSIYIHVRCAHSDQWLKTPSLRWQISCLDYSLKSKYVCATAYWTSPPCGSTSMSRTNHVKNCTLGPRHSLPPQQSAPPQSCPSQDTVQPSMQFLWLKLGFIFPSHTSSAEAYHISTVSKIHPESDQISLLLHSHLRPSRHQAEHQPWPIAPWPISLLLLFPLNNLFFKLQVE